MTGGPPDKHDAPYPVDPNEAPANQTLEEILSVYDTLKANSTRVNGWWAHREDGTIRGPFCRWLTVSEVDPIYKKNVAEIGDDVDYAAAAMNDLPKVIEALRTAMSQIKVELCNRGLEETYEEIKEIVRRELV